MNYKYRPSRGASNALGQISVVASTIWRQRNGFTVSRPFNSSHTWYVYIFISPRCRSWSKCVSLPVSAPCVLLLHRIDACARWSVYSERERRRSRGPRPTHYYSPAVWGVAGCCVFAPERELHAAETLETEARDDEQTMCNLAFAKGQYSCWWKPAVSKLTDFEIDYCED